MQVDLLGWAEVNRSPPSCSEPPGSAAASPCAATGHQHSISAANPSFAFTSLRAAHSQQSGLWSLGCFNLNIPFLIFIEILLFLCFEAGLDDSVHAEPVEEILSCCGLLKQVGAEQPRICAWTCASQQTLQVNASFMVLASQDSAI